MVVMLAERGQWHASRIVIRPQHRDQPDVARHQRQNTHGGIEARGGERHGVRANPNADIGKARQLRSESGTMPPFSASFAITALCSAIFCSALPSSPAWTPNSCPSSRRAARLESRSSSFSRSTIDDW
ncbi:hypothetical protein WR25_15998 [Diploscapter pachys]|uniref:Uncharacterized protein n=1 Tax=Diploscapter pachys TaxID=2018661 RepID=A0A2A2M4Y7_9BILA|nr:hypothetical protein WR25_15998 [Diploscapter pachys]